jgi:hypothetical protein
MNTLFLRALAPLVLALTVAVPAFAAGTPPPKPSINVSKVPLHTEFVVEGNKKGQIVRVKSGKSTSNYTYNAQTYGNVLQMWIRHPDGTAQVGLYRVTYDYDPKTHGIRRGVALVKAGGNWGDKQGAADQMMEIFKKNEAKGSTAPAPNLPSLNAITGRSSTPTPKP